MEGDARGNGDDEEGGGTIVTTEHQTKRNGEKWTPTLASWRAPLRWHAPRECVVLVDLFAPSTPADLRWLVWATMASRGNHRFRLTTAYPKVMQRFLDEIVSAGPKAGERYFRSMMAHFKKYKCKFTEGYTLPEPPTPELRHLYDMAAKIEGRLLRPDGTTLHCGFSGGEFHWRGWPLSNVVVVMKEEQPS